MASFIFKRNALYHVIRSLIPSSILVVVSWATFWIPPTSYPARVGLTATCFLSTMVLYQTSITTAVDYLTAMQVFLVSNLTFIALVLVEFIVTLQTMEKDRKNEITKITAHDSSRDICTENTDKQQGDIPDFC